MNVNIYPLSVKFESFMQSTSSKIKKIAEMICFSAIKLDRGVVFSSSLNIIESWAFNCSEWD